VSTASAVVPTPERRRERRIAVHLPMLVRGTDRTGHHFEERTTSENLCRGGAAFATRYGLDLGMKVDISIPSNSATREPQPEFSTHGRIVHLAAGKTEHERIVGVEFTGPHFHRMFVSEKTDRHD
jgi:c-di-GMP-binding flagellar brake protein YcgR